MRRTDSSPGATARELRTDPGRAAFSCTRLRQHRLMDVAEWVAVQGGIVHRDAARGAHWPDRAVRSTVRSGRLRIIRRTWLATPAAPVDLIAAASAGARIACMTLARERGWWMPDDADPRRHLSLHPHARPGIIEPDDVVHWSKQVAPASVHSLRESIEDALDHIARCASPESARVIWESAIRAEKLSVDALRRVKWMTRAGAQLAREVSDLSDSGLESIFLVRLGPWGVPITQQRILAGRPVDFLIGRSLVVQVDGYGFHRTAADRGRDVSHDAELRLRGYSVLRFTYAQVLHDWPGVERTIARALAGGLHEASVR